MAIQEFGMDFIKIPVDAIGILGTMVYFSKFRTPPFFQGCPIDTDVTIFSAKSDPGIDGDATVLFSGPFFDPEPDTEGV